MELMKGSQAAAGTPTPTPVDAMGDTEAPPMASPMSTPEPKMGSKEAALINISMAIDLLEQSLPAFGSVSDEGKKTLNAIRVLSGLIGQKKGKTDELQQSEILQMLQTLPQAGGATPEGRAIAQAPIPGISASSGMPTPPPM